MTKPLLLLAALALFCSSAIIPVFARESCNCIGYSTRPVHRAMIKKIEVIPPAGHCRRTEIIVSMKSGKIMCTNPGTKWINDLLKKLQKEREVSSETTRPTTTSTTEQLI